MTTILYILIPLAMLGTVVALIRGIIQFLKSSQADLDGNGPSASGLKQNRMMQLRIAFQAIAVLLVVLFLLISGTRG